MFKKNIRNRILSIDSSFARAFLRISEEKPLLISFYGHGLVNKNDIPYANKVLYSESYKQLTVDLLRQSIEYFKENGFKYVSPNDLINTLNDCRAVLLTFDDGYYNNVNVLPILKEYDIPATIFVATDIVHEGHSFWWDVIYRERIKRGASYRHIRREIESLKLLGKKEIDKYIETEFGKSSWKPAGEIDRPFTPKELAEIAKEKNIFLGNHTKSHAILSNLSLTQARMEIDGAQDALTKMTGKRPEIIAYPSGEHTCRVIELAKDAGLKLGVTAAHRINRFPIDVASDAAMTISRFGLDGRTGIIEQCQSARSNVGFLAFYRYITRNRINY